MMLTRDFLNTVVTCPTPGYFCMGVSNGGSGWLEEWHRYPDEIDKIVERSAKLKDSANVYFSSYLFKAPQSTKENVLPTRTIQADLDNADISNLPKAPTVLVETSPGRHQAYWVLDQVLPSDQHEELSKKLTYSIPLCDRSGWPLGRKVRIPDTLNHKYLDGPKQVKIINDNPNAKYNPEEFEALPAVPNFTVEHFDINFVEDATATDLKEHPLEILERIKNDIPVRIYVQYTTRQDDRSEALWALMLWGFRAGLNRNEVFVLARGSANNKFADLRYRADQDLAKDVLRAEHAVRSDQQDARTLVYNVLKSGAPVLDKKRSIYTIVIEELKKQGVFLHTQGGLGWYIRKDVGRPISITAGSEALQALLDIQFGLNPTEPESRFVIHALKSHVHALPDNALQSALSYYDPVQRHLLIHTGRRTVLRITASSIDQIVDGAYNLVFPWIQSVEAFTPILKSDTDWGEELFGVGTRGFGTSVDNITNMTPKQAKALMKVWLLFLLFRNAANTRPIIASFGQPGSGKTTLFKKVYTLLYGRHRSIGAVTTMDDFDHATASDPLVVLDNVDTWEKWLPDRIALSASTSDVVKRKLYTDLDVITLRRQAIVGVTAHNPKFGREDVADRFLLFTFQRFEKFFSEELILADIHSKRNAIWGAIIKDAQRVLQTPIPQQGVPQFRIEDFARYGLWIATALGCQTDFTAAIEDVKSAQQSFSLEEDGLLVAAIMKFAAQAKDPTRHYGASQLWSILEGCADDPRSFQGIYRNSVLLSKKLNALQPALKKVVDITQTLNDAGARVWRINTKERKNGS
jgi:hypothetical protein